MFLYELLALCSFSLTLALLVYVHMNRVQVQAQQGKVVLYSEVSRDLISKLTDIAVQHEQAINALHKKITEKKKEESKSPPLSMNDVMANITEGALADGDLET